MSASDFNVVGDGSIGFIIVHYNFNGDLVLQLLFNESSAACFNLYRRARRWVLKVFTFPAIDRGLGGFVILQRIKVF